MPEEVDLLAELDNAGEQAVEAAASNGAPPEAPLDQLPPTPPAPEAPPPEPPALSGVREYYHGQNVTSAMEFEDDAAMLDQLWQSAQRGHAIGEETAYFAAQGREFAELQQTADFQEWQKSLQGPPAAPQQVVPEPTAALKEGWAGWGKVPEHDESWAKHIIYDADLGRNRLVDGALEMGASPSTLQKYTANAEWEVNSMRKLLRELPELLDSHAEHLFENKFRDIIREDRQQDWGQRAASQQTQQYIDANVQNLFVHDESGQRLHDPATGEELMTVNGQLVKHHAQTASDLIELAIRDPAAARAKVADYAFAQTDRDVGLAQHIAENAYPGKGQTNGEPAKPTPTQRNSDNKETFLDQASREQGQNVGEAPPPGRNISATALADRTDISFDELVDAEMNAHGIPLGIS